jgi:hypothetical protein
MAGAPARVFARSLPEFRRCFVTYGHAHGISVSFNEHIAGQW